MTQFDDLTLVASFIVIGIFTFTFRAIFLYNLPKRFSENDIIKTGLNSVSSSLLVALVIPFAFFVNLELQLVRIEVLAILVTIPIIYIIKKPGLSLPIAIVVYFVFTAI